MVRSWVARWHPSRMQGSCGWVPVVCALRRPPATFWHPLGARRFVGGALGEAAVRRPGVYEDGIQATGCCLRAGARACVRGLRRRGHWGRAGAEGAAHLPYPERRTAPALSPFRAAGCGLSDAHKEARHGWCGCPSPERRWPRVAGATRDRRAALQALAELRGDAMKATASWSAE
jgi:hypothetical protein